MDEPGRKRDFTLEQLHAEIDWWEGYAYQEPPAQEGEESDELVTGEVDFRVDEFEAAMREDW
jgi:hypothetical protein